LNVGSKEGVYSVLLEEFEDVAGVIEPTDRQIIDKGEVCETIILSFNGEILKRLIESEEVYPGGYLKSINGQHPWYIYGQGPSKLAVMLAPIGAPMIVGQLEELAARGFKNFIILGSCGVLDRSIEADKIILPAAALRDEGTSYHYAPPGDEVAYDESLLVELEAIFDKHDIEHIRTSLGRRMPFIGKRLRKSSVAWLLEPKWWTWKLQLSWLGVNFARVKSISSSTQLTMWIIITEPGMPAMKNGRLMP